MSEDEHEPTMGVSWSKRAPFILLTVLGVIFVLVGLRLMLYRPSQEIEIIQATDNATTTSIKVDVAGAVVKSGLINLNQGARMQDAIESAGGLSENADTDWIAKNLNLALVLKDGQKIYIPEIGEKIAATNTDNITGITDILATININTASKSELESLAGVGPVTADKIITARPYSDVNELLTKNIIGQSLFEKIKQMISI